MKVSEAIEHTINLSNLIERLHTLPNGGRLSDSDTMFIISILESVKDLILQSEVFGSLKIENPIA